MKIEKFVYIIDVLRTIFYALYLMDTICQEFMRNYSILRIL